MKKDRTKEERPSRKVSVRVNLPRYPHTDSDKSPSMRPDGVNYGLAGRNTTDP